MRRWGTLARSSGWSALAGLGAALLVATSPGPASGFGALSAPAARFTASAYGSARPILVWETAGGAAGTATLPIDVALGPDGSVYVLEYGPVDPAEGAAPSAPARVQRFDARGRFLGSWGGGQLHRPIGLAISNDGDVWVADTFNHVIRRFGPQGEPRATWGSQGSALGQLDRPTDLAFDAAGNVYVVEYGNQRVQVFDAAGRPVRAWGSEGDGPGQFRGPHGVAVDRHGEVYVADTNNHRVAKFSATGLPKGLWASEPAQEPDCPPRELGQLCRPRHLAVDPAGNLLVADRNHHRIHVFTGDGRPLATVGVEGGRLGELSFPYAAAISPEGDLYVADTGNGRIQLFALGAPQRFYLPFVRR